MIAVRERELQFLRRPFNTSAPKKQNKIQGKALHWRRKELVTELGSTEGKNDVHRVAKHMAKSRHDVNYSLRTQTDNM